MCCGASRLLHDHAKWVSAGAVGFIVSQSQDHGSICRSAVSIAICTATAPLAAPISKAAMNVRPQSCVGVARCR
jgi:hypothetical protein